MITKSKIFQTPLTALICGLLGLLFFKEAKAQTAVDFSSSGLYLHVPVQIEGQDYVWLCMDIDAKEPSAQQVEYYLSTNPADIAVLGLADITQGEMTAISAAIKNIYLNNQSAILEQTDDPPVDFRYATQAAAWYLILGARDDVWSDTLDATAIGALIAYEPYHFMWENNPPAASFSDLMNSALVPHPAAENWDVFFGVPAEVPAEGDKLYQPLMFLSATPVPEPSLVSLLSLTGIALLGRRRRK